MIAHIKKQSQLEQMKTRSKTMNTLLRFRRRRDSAEVPTAVEFSPEELDDLTPLKPEEADEYQLAEFFKDLDLSFLFESQSNENLGEVAPQQQRGKRKRKRKAPPAHEHQSRIPTDDRNDKATKHASKGNKRMRLSHPRE
jgi:hypothetical protein